MIYITDFRIQNGVLREVLRKNANTNNEEETIIVPESVKKIGDGAFLSWHDDFTNIVSIRLPKTVEEISDTSFPTYIYVQSCSSLSKLTSIEVDPENPFYQSIDGALYNKAGDTLIRCPHARTSLHIPEGVTAISNFAFQPCNLTEVTLPKSLKTIGMHAFADCESLASIVIPECVSSIAKSTFERCSALTAVTFPKSLRTIEERAFAGCESLTKLIVPEGLASIGNCAFDRCKALAEVTFPHSLRTIEYGAFSDCESLATLIIPEGLTSIGNGAFNRCKALTEITLPHSLRIIEHFAFDACPSLKKLIIPEGITSTGKCAFACSSLTELTLPGSLKKISLYSFADCESLEKLVISEGVAAIDDSAFIGCKALKEVTLPSSLKEISRFAFAGCESLEKLVIPEGVIAIGFSAFKGCKALKEATLPNSLAVFGTQVFDGCESLSTSIAWTPYAHERPIKYATDRFDVEDGVLTRVLLTTRNPYDDERLIVPASVKKIASCAFSYNPPDKNDDQYHDLKGVEIIHLPKSVEEISSDVFGQYRTLPKLSSIEVDPENPCYQSIDGVLYNKAGDTLIRCPYTKTSLHIPEGVTIIAESALRGCNLTEVTLPPSLKTIEAHAFADCDYLTKLVIPDGVTSIGKGAFFRSCLTEITLPKGLKKIEAQVFSGCCYLTKLVIPEGISSIGEDAFSGCRLTEITLPRGLEAIKANTFEKCGALIKIVVPEGVTSIGEKAFLNCDALAEVTLPNSLNTIGIEAFEECFSLQKLVIPEGVTSIGKEAFCRSGLTDLTLLCAGLNTFAHAFKLCEHLSKVTLPDGLRMIDTCAFDGCKSLESIVLPNSIRKIANEAFGYCRRLTSIVLPEGLTELNGFEWCSSLTEISIPESVSVIGESAFGSCSALKHITMHTAQGQFLISMLRGPNKPSVPPIIHIEDSTTLTAKYRVYAAIGFALDHRDCTDENGKKYLKYIKANAARLASAAVEYRELFDLMLREQLIAAKDLEAFSAVIQASGQDDLIAALQAYAEQLPAPKKRKQ